MGKRFTSTDKWTDGWHVDLSAEHKLAWDYVCGRCDAAGVLDHNHTLANAMIGLEVDWDGFLAACGDRIEVLPDGKWWLTGFIEFQYGQLSEECRGHNQVFASLKKHNLTDRVFKGYSKAIHSLKDKDKDKDKDKEGGSGGKRFEPPSLETVSAYVAEKGYDVDAEAFVAYYTARGWVLSNGRKMKYWSAALVTWHKNSGRFSDNRGSPNGKPRESSAEILARAKRRE